MTMCFRTFSLASLLLASLLLTACLTRPEVKTEGEQNLAASTPLGRVVVLPFQGPFGAMLAGRVSYELMQRGQSVIPQDRVRAALTAEGQDAASLYGEGGHERIVALAAKLGADTVVIGNVTPRDKADNQLTRVADQFRSAAPLKVKEARAEFLRASDGATLAAASFAGEREYGVFTPNYRDAARGLVEAILGE